MLKKNNPSEVTFTLNFHLMFSFSYVIEK